MDDGEGLSTERGNENRNVGGVDGIRELFFCCIVCISTQV